MNHTTNKPHNEYEHLLEDKPVRVIIANGERWISAEDMEVLLDLCSMPDGEAEAVSQEAQELCNSILQHKPHDEEALLAASVEMAEAARFHSTAKQKKMMLELLGLNRKVQRLGLVN